MSNLTLKTIIFFRSAPGSRAQKTMSLDEAIMQALENNYSLKISRNDQTVAQQRSHSPSYLPLPEQERQSQTTNSTSPHPP
jgi:hypothetical protein